MATLQVRKIAEALAKAQGVGQVEEDATIAGCRVVLRSLRPDEYEQIHAECAEKEDLAYLNAYRSEHLARSIVELNGEDLRSVEFVEVDGPDGAPINIERHEFMRDYVLSTWSREAVDVAFRKFNDVVQKADKASAEGVHFDTPDETAEEKYRRLMTEMRDLEGELPMDLALRLLEEAGYTKRVSTQDFEAAQERLKNMVAANEAKTADSTPDPAPQAPPAAAAPAPVARPQAPLRQQPYAGPPVGLPKQEPMPAAAGTTRPASPEDLMRVRQPIHGQPAAAPAVTPARPTGQPPALTRSQQIAMEEGLAVDPSLPDASLAISGGTEIPEVQPRAKIDPNAAAAILDRPPTGGQNRRFRPPPT